MTYLEEKYLEQCKEIDDLNNKLARAWAQTCTITHVVPADQPKASSSESLGQKIDRLIAYFEKRSRENAKRAEKNEKRQYTEFQRLDEIVQKDRSGYFFSGKSEAYDNAARKIKEVLGETKFVTQVVEANSITYKEPEKWVIDMRPKHGPDKEWGPSGDSDVCGTFPSKAEAEEAIAHNGASLVERRARRIERLDERNPKPFVWVSQRFSTMNGSDTKEAHEN